MNLFAEWFTVKSLIRSDAIARGMWRLNLISTSVYQQRARKQILRLICDSFLSLLLLAFLRVNLHKLCRFVSHHSFVISIHETNIESVRRTLWAFSEQNLGWLSLKVWASDVNSLTADDWNDFQEQRASAFLSRCRLRRKATAES